MLTHPSFYHFSVDDVFNCLIEVTDAQISLFEHPFFAFLQSLHQTYGTSIDLYLFYQGLVQGKPRCLSEVSSHLQPDFRASPWLRLGPHAWDYKTAPYAQSPAQQKETFEAIYQEIERFGDQPSRWLRLHYFSEAYELAPYWQSKGVDTLLLTDKPAAAYRLPEAARTRLASEGVIEYQGLYLRRSHDRVENLVADNLSLSQVHSRLASHLEKYHFLVLFSHEIDLANPLVQTTAQTCLSYVSQQGLSSE